MGEIYGMSRKDNCGQEIIYHYCSIETFKSIIDNSTLRLTNIIKSNDHKEIVFALEEISRVTMHTFTKICKNNSQIYELIKNFDFDSYYNGILKELNLSYYVFCFSSESDLLSQWRGYANNGKGIALGFNSSYLKKLSKSYKNFRYDYVIYDPDELSKNCKAFIKQRLNLILQKAEYKLSDIENILFSLLNIAIYTAVFYKNPAFREENEKRLVYFPFGNIRSLRKTVSYSDNIENDRYFDHMLEHFNYDGNIYGDFKLSAPSFFVRENQLISYFDLSFNDIKEFLISEIMLGPKTELDDTDLRLYLLSKGYDLNYLNIRKSNAPYK